ncbi:SDR family NAD(P)-dependent oxidoreductase [Frigidibacter sp. RF13]|uniref:SDR family NAD(P)-dependent oxidoreductase n=1 Tax=Frigidibacter sp. RF13 TaxID=2997340 RepID=UPI00226E5CD0|nr:SDR family NAD(P)-dependent oxidoreductase [Frigidibacter sp. RF13]MCY1125263.1 SDR family NAD(P)-dependent oxidoreductase [Frigidibacter sp. RF13]
MTLSGKRVLITGGGSGAGADLALGFARAGAEVVITGRRLEALEAVARSSPAIRPVRADVTREADVRAMFAEAGPCDIVIANAGAADSGVMAKTTLDQWNAMIAVNLTGVFLTLRDGLNQMSGWGRLIAMASTAGLKGYAKVAPYAAAKHGVVGMVRSLALEVARRPVTVNALCPGFLDTPMTDHSVEVIAEKTGRSLTEARAALEALSPQNRLIAPAEVTAAALWLCAPGSEGMNGQAIAIAGGEV